MPRFTIPVVNGSYTKKVDNKNANHVLSVSASDSATAGTVAVEAKAPGSDKWYPLPDGLFTLPQADTALFTYVVGEYRLSVNLTNVGTSTELVITDINAEVRYG